MNLRKLVPVAVLPVALMVGTYHTALADCSTPGTHWHWRSSTDKFRSEKTWTNCLHRTDGSGGCTSYYKAYNYFYYCSPDIGGICYWKYTGSISNHHTHKCIWF